MSIDHLGSALQPRFGDDELLAEQLYLQEKDVAGGSRRRLSTPDIHRARVVADDITRLTPSDSAESTVRPTRSTGVPVTVVNGYDRAAPPPTAYTRLNAATP